jgi:hypothetical protein
MIFPTQALVAHYCKIILTASVALCFFVIEIVSMRLCPKNSILICFVKKSKWLRVHAHCLPVICLP